MINSPHSQVWNTDAIASKEKFSYWSDALCSSLMKMDLDRRQSGNFNAELRMLQLGDIHFNHVLSDEHVARLNGAGISRLEDHYFYLLVQKSGILVGHQHGVENFLMPGDSLFVDSLHPFQLDFPERFECISVRIPRSLLRPFLSHPQRLCTRVVRSNSDLGKAIYHYTHYLMNDVGAGKPAATQGKTDAFLGLISSHNSNQKDGSSLRRRSAGMGHLAKIKRFLRHNYSKSDLSPGLVAKEFNISVNYLHKLFAKGSVTFGAYLRELRLVRASEILSDPISINKSISEVALEVGFNDLSYFDRLFVKKFSLTPSAFRAITQQDD